jgi:glutathione S-transferase
MLDEAGADADADADYEIVSTLLKDKAHKKPELLKINPAGKRLAPPQAGLKGMKFG